MAAIRGIFHTLALVGALSFATPNAHADGSAYRISPGETVEIKIASIPEWLARPVVQTDGTISLVDAGAIVVGGMTPAQMQIYLEQVLPTHLFHRRSQAGTMETVIIGPGDITSSVVAYRPIYVSGDVLTPGEQTYRPMMTARQAIAVSGGYSLVHVPVTSQKSAVIQKSGDPVELQRDFESLGANYAKAIYHNRRLVAELAGRDEFDMRAPDGIPLSDTVVSQIAKSEANELKVTVQDRNKNDAYLLNSIKASADQIDTLSERLEVETSAQTADESDMSKVTKLLRIGDASNARVSEIRRNLMLSSGRRLSTLVELLRAKGQRVDYERQIVRNTDQWKISLLKEMQEGNMRLADLSAKLRVAKLKLETAGLATGVGPAVDPALTSRVTVVRQIGGEWQHLASSIDSEILPGDVLEVSLCSRTDASSATCEESLSAGTQ